MLILKMSIIYDFQASEKLSTKQCKIPTELSGIIKLLKMLSYISQSHFLKIEGEREKLIIRLPGFSNKQKAKKSVPLYFQKGTDEVFVDMPKV